MPFIVNGSGRSASRAARNDSAAAGSERPRPASTRAAMGSSFSACARRAAASGSTSVSIHLRRASPCTIVAIPREGDSARTHARPPAQSARIRAAMLGQLPSVFLDVVAPVFAIVALGWALGPRLALDARTVSRAAYYLFVPAFTFDVIARSDVPLGSAARMVAFAVVAHAAFALIGFAVARALRRPPEITAAYVMLAVFGNVGNFGLALVQFRFGERALAPATIYYIAILVTSFVVCVAAAAWVRGGGPSAIGSVLRTPALWVVPPAMLVAGGIVPLPLSVSRSVGLLGSAMIPAMLLALGLQLAEARRLRVTADVFAVTGLRLVAAPLVAAAIAGPFRLGELERATGILQSGTPAAILVAIIAVEHDIAPPFVTTAVIFTTLCSLATLTVLLALV